MRDDDIPQMNYGTWYNAYGTGEGDREKCAPPPAAAMFYPEEVRRRCVEQAQEKAPRYRHGSMEHEKEKTGSWSRISLCADILFQ